MNVPTLLLRPDLGKKAYRLRCRFSTPAYPKAAWLEEAKYTAAEQFVKDLAKQGFQYLDRHGFQMTGPFPKLNISSTLPRHSWQYSAREALARMQAGLPVGDRHGRSHVSAVSPLDASEEWDYELAGVFIHNTILTEMPDAHEESEELRNR